MATVEYGKCSICGQKSTVLRKYYYYPFPCECCGNEHAELVFHCENCKPKPPKVIKVTLKHDVALKLRLEEE